MPRLRAGEDPEAILASLIAPDPGADQRQFHILAATGRIAQHTGRDCVPWPATWRRRTSRSPATCWPARRPCAPRWRRISRRRGPWPNASWQPWRPARQPAATSAANNPPRQTASHDPYPDLDIRADDHPDPLTELCRLYRVNLERYAVFRRMLPGTDSAWGTLDRATIDATIARDRVPPR